MFKRIDHVEIIPNDVERSIRFYIDNFAANLKGRHKIDAGPLKEVIYLGLGDTVLEFLAVENPQPASTQPWQVGYRGIALEIENMDKAVGYLKDKGIEITWGPIDLGRSIRAEIKDPDGLPIELREWKR